MKRTLNTLFVDAFSTDSQVSAHMKAIGGQCIYLLVCTSENYQIMSVDVYCPDSLRFQLASFDDIEPSIRIWWWCFSQIFLLRVVIPSIDEMGTLIP